MHKNFTKDPMDRLMKVTVDFLSCSKCYRNMEVRSKINDDNMLGICGEDRIKLSKNFKNIWREHALLMPR